MTLTTLNILAFFTDNNLLDALIWVVIVLVFVIVIIKLLGKI